LDAQIEQSNVSLMPQLVSRTIPLSIGRSQMIYWSYTWRAGEEETRKSLAEGQGRTFADGRETIRWLLSDDD
jgi:hypothetical protein